MTRPNVSSPYLDFDRRAWSGLRNSFPQVLTEDDLEKIRGIGESIDLAEVADVLFAAQPVDSLADSGAAGADRNN